MRRFLGATAVAANAAITTPAQNNVDAQRYVEGRRFYYIYQTPNIASLAATAQGTQVIQFDIDSIFVWMRMTMLIDLAGAAQTESAQIVPLITVQITDTGSGTNFFNNPVPMPSIAGNGKLPYVMPTQQMVQPAASLQFAFTNYSAATTYNNVRLQLHGFKVYGSQAPAQFGG